MSSKAGALTLDIQKLRVVLNALLDHVEVDQGRLVDIDRDHYWLLELDSAFASDLREPGSEGLGVGQISDDIETIHELAAELESGDAFLAPWHDLQHSVGLLSALAWKDLPA